MSSVIRVVKNELVVPLVSMAREIFIMAVLSIAMLLTFSAWHAAAVAMPRDAWVIQWIVFAGYEAFILCMVNWLTNHTPRWFGFTRTDGVTKSVYTAILDVSALLPVIVMLMGAVGGVIGVIPVVACILMWEEFRRRVPTLSQVVWHALRQRVHRE